jgi:predicted RNA-binding protein with EMAP domain
MKVIITESQLRYLTEQFYDPDKLYLTDYILDRIKNAPKYIKKLGKNLDYIPKVIEKTGETKYYTTISQQLYQYLFGNY